MKKKYIEEKKDFILLITGSTDNDYAAERAADPTIEVVHHKLFYVPMYGDFSELMYLQEKLRGSEYGLGRRVCCAIDISEWIGHEDEEYFIVSLKYLHDHRDGIDYIFTVSEYGEADVKKLYFKLSCYMSGMIFMDKTFMSAASLSGLIESYGIARSAAQLMSELIMLEEMSELRSYPVVRMMCSEICSYSENEEPAGMKELSLYLDKTGSLPSILDSDITEKYSEEAKRLGSVTPGKRIRGRDKE